MTELLYLVSAPHPKGGTFSGLYSNAVTAAVAGHFLGVATCIAFPIQVEGETLWCMATHQRWPF